MIANYHTHTPRCHHAKGTEREYVENAIRAGIKRFGFADHSPIGETGAAALAAAEFAKNTASFVYLINGRFAPFYKWALRGMKNLEILPDFSQKLSALLTGGFTPDEITIKQNIIENICSLTADYLRNSDLAQSSSDFLEPLAYQVQNKIKSSEIRSLHIMEGGSL